MIYLELFWEFLKIGMFSFGGAYGAIPLIREAVLSKAWLSEEMVSYMIAVSESTPGPIIVNLATYVGSLKGGVLGSFIATAAVIFPAFLIILLLMVILKNAINNRYVRSVLDGLKPAIIGIILATGLYMTIKNILPESCFQADIRSLILTAVLGAGYFTVKYIFKKDFSPIIYIIISAVFGIGVNLI